MGSPVLLRVSDRPARHAPDGAFATEQRVASDPEVHMHLGRVFSQLAYAGPARILIAITYPAALDERAPIPAHAKERAREAHYRIPVQNLMEGQGQTSV